MIGQQVSAGLTSAQLQDYINQLQSRYGYMVGNTDLTDISVREENNSLILNINNREFVLDQSSQESLYAQIMNALRQLGIK